MSVSITLLSLCYEVLLLCCAVSLRLKAGGLERTQQTLPRCRAGSTHPVTFRQMSREHAIIGIVLMAARSLSMVSRSRAGDCAGELKQSCCQC